MARQKFPWPIEDLRQMYDSGKSLREIADALSSEVWQPYWRKHLGHEYRPSQKVVNKVAKRAGIALRSRGAPLERNGFWRGGRRIDRGGYILVKCPEHPMATAAGYVREHRLVMERILGRYLTETEVVHHKDDDPSNNDPHNLLLFDTNAIHISTTMTGKVPSSRIVVAQEAVARHRREWWPAELLRTWHIVDQLPMKEIGKLLGMNPRTVSAALRRLGIPVRVRYGRSVPPTATTDHERQAREFLAKHPSPTTRGDARLR